MAVSGEVDVDQLRKLLFQSLVVQAHLGQALQTHVGAEDVGILQQLQKYLLAAVSLQIQADQTLSVVLDGEDGTGKVLDGQVDIQARVAPWIAAGGFDLDDLRAIFRHQAAGRGDCHMGAQFQHFDSLQWCIHHCVLSFAFYFLLSKGVTTKDSK